MIRSLSVATLATLVVTGCTSNQENQDREEVSLVPGFSGGCKDGFVVYVQNQFEPYGSSLRNDPEEESQGDVVYANDRLIVIGWFDTGTDIYPENPEGIKGNIWYYVPKLRGWVADAAVRSEVTSPAPSNANRHFDEAQAPSKPDECQLNRSN